jgi:hypothetical protein
VSVPSSITVTAPHFRTGVHIHGHNSVIATVGGLHYVLKEDRLLTTAIGVEPILMWDSRSHLQVAKLKPRPGWRFISPTVLSDGNTLAAREATTEHENTMIQIWQAPTWEEIQRIEDLESPDVKPIASQ